MSYPRCPSCRMSDLERVPLGESLVDSFKFFEPVALGTRMLNTIFEGNKETTTSYSFLKCPSCVSYALYCQSCSHAWQINKKPHIGDYFRCPNCSQLGQGFEH